jgi:hypothetical protein
VTTLADLLSFVVTTLQTSQLCNEVHVLATHQFSDRQFALKVRASLTGGASLQVRLYRNGDHIDYAYHLVIADRPVRWDNKEHFPSLSTHPHHFHSASGRVEASPLSGKPRQDLPTVLDVISQMTRVEPD